MSGSRENEAMTHPDRDALVQRYQEANDFDANAVPPAALREKVLARAEQLAAQNARKGREAANQPWWKWSAAASVLVLVAAGWLGMRQWSEPPYSEDTMVASVDDAAKRELSATPTDDTPKASSGETEPAMTAAAPSAEAVAPPLSENRAEVVTRAEAPTTKPAPEAKAEAEAEADTNANTDAESKAKPKLPPAAKAEAEAVAASQPDQQAGADVLADNSPVVIASAPLPPAAPQAADEASVLADRSRAVQTGKLAAETRGKSAEIAELASPPVPAAASSPPTRASRMAAPVLPGWQEHLASGGNPDERDVKGLTWLMRAAKVGDELAVQALLKAGARRELQTQDGLTASDFARTAGHEKLARQLLP